MLETGSLKERPEPSADPVAPTIVPPLPLSPEQRQVVEERAAILTDAMRKRGVPDAERKAWEAAERTERRLPRLRAAVLNTLAARPATTPRRQAGFARSRERSAAPSTSSTSSRGGPDGPRRAAQRRADDDDEEEHDRVALAGGRR
jgi:hypothetical protein